MDSASLALRRQNPCLGLVPLVSEVSACGEPHRQRVRTLAAVGCELRGQRVLGAGHGEKDAALSHSSTCMETQHIFCLVNLDELRQIHQFNGFT